MARYSVDIQANLIGFEKLANAEQQIKQLQNLSKNGINLKFNINDFKNVTTQFQNIGKQASVSFGKGFNINSNLVQVGDFTKIKSEIIKHTNDIQKEIQQHLKSQGLKIDIFNQDINSDSINKWSNEYVKKEQKAFEKIEKETQKQQAYINKIREKTNSGLFEYRSSKNNSFLEKYSGQDSTALSKARSQIAEIEQLQSKLKSGSLSGADTISTYERLEKVLGKLSHSMKQVGIETSKTLDPKIADTSANKVKAYYEANTRAISKYGNELKEIEERYRRVKTVEDKLNIDRDYKNLQSKISSEGLTGKSAFHEFKRAFKSIAEFTSIYGTLQNVMYEVPRQMINAVMDVNKAQIELMKVSDAPDLELNRYWNEAAESAKKYGATISDVIKSTADWSRLGYNLDDAKKLSDVTTLLTKVGDNMTQESASQGLISTLKGFDLTADKAQSIVDKVNEVANTEPIDTAGLFAGLERSASSLSTANNSLEQSIALITAGNTIVQDPNKVGTGFKTISMRIRGAKTDLEEAGLETEGMAKSTAKLRDELISLSGVDIMLDDKTFKSTYDIMDELSKKWKEINDIDKANIIELIAGRQNLPVYIEICA